MLQTYPIPTVELHCGGNACNSQKFALYFIYLLYVLVNWLQGEGVNTGKHLPPNSDATWHIALATFLLHRTDTIITSAWWLHILQSSSFHFGYEITYLA